MVVSMPRKGLVSTEPPDMVRVQLKPNDIRSYRRRDAEEMLKSTPGAFIIGEQAADVAPPDESEDDASTPAPARARRAAPNKARQPKTPEPAESEQSAPDDAGAETKSAD